MKNRFKLPIAHFKLFILNFKFLIFLQFGVADSRVVDGAQFLLEDALYRGDILEGDGAELEEALAHLRVDDFLHQVADALFGIFG